MQFGHYTIQVVKPTYSQQKIKRNPEKTKKAAQKRGKKKKTLICLSKEIETDFKIPNFEKLTMKIKFVCFQSDLENSIIRGCE